MNKQKILSTKVNRQLYMNDTKLFAGDNVTFVG